MQRPNKSGVPRRYSTHVKSGQQGGGRMLNPGQGAPSSKHLSHLPASFTLEWPKSQNRPGLHWKAALVDLGPHAAPYSRIPAAPAPAAMRAEVAKRHRAVRTRVVRVFIAAVARDSGR